MPSDRKEGPPPPKHTQILLLGRIPSLTRGDILHQIVQSERNRRTYCELLRKRWRPEAEDLGGSPAYYNSGEEDELLVHHDRLERKDQCYYYTMSRT